MQLMLGDCFQKLLELPDNSVDSIVTDPPYGLSFMGKSWDYDVPGQNIWEQCLRVLKPGGHLLAFFGTRTYHRGVVRIEDAGFEIRDQIMWIYGSGFPKSTDVSKRIDKEAGAEREVVGEKKKLESYGPNKVYGSGPDHGGIQKITAPSTPEAIQWQGWGTALKPANEPIVVARKPLEKGLTVAQNVLKWGTGALNIDGCRIETVDNLNGGAYTKGRSPRAMNPGGLNQVNVSDIGDYKQPLGRWPANVILDEEAAKALDEQSGQLRARNGTPKGFTNGGTGSTWMMSESKKGTGQKVVRENENGTLAGASRFFYVAKASKSERNGGIDIPNIHPTIKPLKLMSYLIKLVTPPSGVVLDPFMGSGSTGVAAKDMGFGFIGIERDPQYFEIAMKRIESAQSHVEIIEEKDESQLEFPA